MPIGVWADLPVVDKLVSTIDAIGTPAFAVWWACNWPWSRATPCPAWCWWGGERRAAACCAT